MTPTYRTAASLYQEFVEHERSKVTLNRTRKFLEINNGSLEWNLHYGQMEALESPKRFVVCIASRQSGKSEIGPLWLYEEIRARGPGNYMVIAPSFPILEASALPKFKTLFEQTLKLGKMKAKPLTFTFSKEGERHMFGNEQSDLTPTIVSFGHGANPGSLEARTSLGAWIDEGGQVSFKSESFEAIEGRHVTTRGRILITSTPYDFGPLKTRYYDKWIAVNKDHEDIDVIQWPSTANPNFPEDEFNRLRGTMPLWRFLMFYCGEYSMPSGLIYDIIMKPESNVLVNSFAIPSNWPRHIGLDFGGVNTFGVYAAVDPVENVAYIYNEYCPNETRNVSSHAQMIGAGAGGSIHSCFGGAGSEGQWRREFTKSGLKVREPDITSYEVGVARVYSLMSQGRLKLFSNGDSTIKINDEIASYRYESDPESGEVLPEAKVFQPNKYHAMDSIRYLCAGLKHLLHQQSGQIASAGGRDYYEPDAIEILQETKTITRTTVRVGKSVNVYTPSYTELHNLTKLKRMY